MFDFPNAKLPRPTPLENSFSFDEVEEELKQLFIALFNDNIASDMFDANVLGVEHLGSIELIKRSVNADGLVFLAGDRDITATRYIYRAWRSRNVQGRGLHFLEVFLQHHFPNNWKITQLVHDNLTAYPLGLSELDNNDKFLTSRLRIEVDATSNNSNNILAITPVIKDIIPARFVPTMRLTAKGIAAFRVVHVFSASQIFNSIGIVTNPSIG